MLYCPGLILIDIAYSITNYVGRRSSDSWLHPRTTQSNNITITSFAISCLKQGSFPPALRLQKAFERKTYASLNGDDVATHIARPTIKEYSKAQARGHLFPSGRPPSPYALVKSPDQINEVASKHVNTHGLIDLVQESFTSSSAGILSQRTREEVAITAIILWTIFIFLWMWRLSIEYLLPQPPDLASACSPFFALGRIYVPVDCGLQPKSSFYSTLSMAQYLFGQPPISPSLSWRSGVCLGVLSIWMFYEYTLNILDFTFLTSVKTPAGI